MSFRLLRLRLFCLIGILKDNTDYCVSNLVGKIIQHRFLRFSPINSVLLYCVLHEFQILI